MIDGQCIYDIFDLFIIISVLICIVIYVNLFLVITGRQSPHLLNGMLWHYQSFALLLLTYTKLGLNNTESYFYFLSTTPLLLIPLSHLFMPLIIYTSLIVKDINLYWRIAQYYTLFAKLALLFLSIIHCFLKGKKKQTCLIYLDKIYRHSKYGIVIVLGLNIYTFTKEDITYLDISNLVLILAMLP
jgi:hypothetical protein